jgi:hypothetical protein
LEQIEVFLHNKQVDELETAVGSSLGAMLVWRLWQRGNIPIWRVILDSPPFDWSPTASMNAESFWRLALAVQAAPDDPCIFDEQYGEFGPMMRRSCLSLTKNTIRRSCETCFGPQFPEDIQTNGTRILLVYGDLDHNYQEKGQMLVDRKNITVVVKSGYGHCGF